MTNIFIIFLEKFGKFADYTKLNGACQREGMLFWRTLTALRGGHLRTSWCSHKAKRNVLHSGRAISSTNTLSLGRE